MEKIYSKIQKIKFAHCDPAGIVFYPRYFEMLNELVEDWFEEELNLPFKQLHQGEGVPTVDIKIQFKKASRIGDILTKKLWVKELGKSSVTYIFQFLNENSTILEGEATLVHVGLSAEKLQSQLWSDEIREKMESFLHKKIENI